MDELVEVFTEGVVECAAQVVISTMSLEGM